MVADFRPIVTVSVQTYHLLLAQRYAFLPMWQNIASSQSPTKKKKKKTRRPARAGGGGAILTHLLSFAKLCFTACFYQRTQGQ